jgi:hypothetical protein
LGKKRLEAIVNLGQFPENRNQQNRDHEQKELGNHLFSLQGEKLETLRHSTTVRE